MSMNEEERKEEARKVIESKKCNGCPDWFKHCNSECCRYVVINVHPSNLEDTGKFFKVKKFLLKDKIWYYKLRGVRYQHGILIFDKNHCYSEGNKIIYRKDCEKLTEDGLCSGHPDNKPEFCKKLDKHTAASGEAFVTPNCLFRYQNMEVVDDAEKKHERYRPDEKKS